MGIVILVCLVFYFFLSITVVIWVVKYAKKNGKSVMRWGCSAALGMYLIPFWDWLPTVAMHQYYCSTEAGFWIYKTPEQWMKDNPGVMESLIDQDRSSDGRFPSWPRGVTETGLKVASINQRFGIRFIDHLSSPDEKELLIKTWRWRVDLVDKLTGEVMARQVDFSAGNGYIG